MDSKLASSCADNRHRHHLVQLDQQSTDKKNFDICVLHLSLQVKKDQNMSTLSFINHNK